MGEISQCTLISCDERLSSLLLRLGRLPRLFHTLVDRRPDIIRFYPLVTCVRMGVVGMGALAVQPEEAINRGNKAGCMAGRMAVKHVAEIIEVVCGLLLPGGHVDSLLKVGENLHALCPISIKFKRQMKKS
jgi:hypothetical protein